MMSPNRRGSESLCKLAYANNLNVSNKRKNLKLWVSPYFHVYTDDGLFKVNECPVGLENLAS